MKVAVVGVGLIGGSIGLAARQRLGAHVSGYDPSAAAREAALARGAVARGVRLDRRRRSRTPTSSFVAAPVTVLAAIVGEVLAAAGPDCVVTDVGSVKRAVVGAIDDPRFIGGHPLAGAETAGVEHARADLFQDATWYLTPTPATRGTAYERLHRADHADRRVAVGDRARHPRRRDGLRLAPAARAGQRARRAGRAGALGARASGCPRPARRSAT